ncbi:AtuA-related protein [Ottowia sp.]|uniref:AtuA-related protein n=1 Tax=Ottowia sp. TaxID=1898956 RepID=UPI003C78A23A
MNFMMHNALAGGVSRTLALDNYGKAMSSAILRMPIDLPEALAQQVQRRFDGKSP